MIDGSLSLMYNNTFKGHNLNICLSSNMRQTQSTASGNTLPGISPGGDLVSSNYAAEVYGKPSSSDNTTRLVGALLTSNYTYNNIYLADLTGRIDGSSEFGSDKRWSMFWSTGAGINIHNYDFMKSNELFSMLKFRASYGLTGKTNFSLYSAKDMYQLQTDSWYPTGYGVFLYQMGNPNLKWERKYTLDYGVEIGLWHDKIYLKASAYDERTIDLITDYTIPSSTGFTSYKENMGKVKTPASNWNCGHDFTVTETGSSSSTAALQETKTRLLKSPGQCATIIKEWKNCSADITPKAAPIQNMLKHT